MKLKQKYIDSNYAVAEMAMNLVVEGNDFFSNSEAERVEQLYTDALRIIFTLFETSSWKFWSGYHSNILCGRNELYARYAKAYTAKYPDPIT